MQSETDDNGEKHMILCRVILGNVEKVEAGSQQCYPSSSAFDTGADDPNNPKWYLVWSTHMSRHILPECVVSYKSSSNSSGTIFFHVYVSKLYQLHYNLLLKPVFCCFLSAELGGFGRNKYTFPELFSKIKSSLTPVKVQECITLYEALKVT